MPAWEFTLGPTPVDPARRKLWMQHAAGFVLFEDVRGYALAHLDPNLTPSERSAAVTAIDDTMYGVMMVLDGVTGALRDPERSTAVKSVIELRHGEAVVAELDMRSSDSMCVGYHGWKDGDFGGDPVATRRPETP